MCERPTAVAGRCRRVDDQVVDAEAEPLPLDDRRDVPEHERRRVLGVVAALREHPPPRDARALGEAVGDELLEVGSSTNRVEAVRARKRPFTSGDAVCARRLGTYGGSKQTLSQEPSS
jgi:hypothetical protein